MDNKCLNRREFFKHGLVQVVGSVREVANAAWGPLQPIAPKPELIRPPGALPESEFLERCTRCDECVKACPEESIMKFVGEGKAIHLTPILNLRKSACVLCEDFPCISVCEPKALTEVASPRDVKMGTAVINKKLCHAWADGMDCDYCVKDCPFPNEAIFLDNDRRPHVNEDICTGCGLCEKICPSRQSAIMVKK